HTHCFVRPFIGENNANRAQCSDPRLPPERLGITSTPSISKMTDTLLIGRQSEAIRYHDPHSAMSLVMCVKLMTSHCEMAMCFTPHWEREGLWVLFVQTLVILEETPIWLGYFAGS
ncbi:MAG: hypothetical protein WAN28_20415, partial [Terracidiphilus sp.]